MISNIRNIIKNAIVNGIIQLILSLKNSGSFSSNISTIGNADPSTPGFKPNLANK